jgi:hypothetical protein
VDLDIKEAYEFSVLNPFLLNEEELNNILVEVNKNEGSQNRSRRDGTLELHNDGTFESEEEE